MLLADALLFSPRGLLFLPDKLLVSCGGLRVLLGGLLQINSWRATVNSSWLAIDCWWCYCLMHCCYLMATLFYFSSCGRTDVGHLKMSPAVVLHITSLIAKTTQPTDSTVPRLQMLRQLLDKKFYCLQQCTSKRG